MQSFKNKLMVSVILSSIIFFSSVAVVSAQTIELPVSLKMNGILYYTHILNHHMWMSTIDL